MKVSIYHTARVDMYNDRFRNIWNAYISAPMILLCGNSIALPLRIIFSNITNTGIFPDKWKHANVTPVYKKIRNI